MERWAGYVVGSSLQYTEKVRCYTVQVSSTVGGASHKRIRVLVVRLLPTLDEQSGMRERIERAWTGWDGLWERGRAEHVRDRMREASGTGNRSRGARRDGRDK